MKKQLITLIVMLILAPLACRAHSVWIETSSVGQLGKQQTVSVYFGEFGKDKREKVGNRFTEVNGFTAWAVSPSGKQTFLKFTPKTNCYQAIFTPSENGTYVILLENKVREVADWRNTSGKLGIIKQNYYARATVQVGDQVHVSQKAFTDLLVSSVHDPGAKSEVVFLATFQGKPLQATTLVVRAPGMQEIKLTTDEQGKVSWAGARPGLYTVTALLRFETPGTYKGVFYEAIREKATFTFHLM
ncbi:MAG: hypothetical protein BGO21_05350 [Dyadobacter sp. 50-39]|uniref:DUF4198 domain-containing protein n=1 Tax=Dyadobacter sp. 50-39 TaxID=1895756 RepID=UPI000969C8BD|nr:DUF4198 domain-containing protein [Dyadobacter sp. 50-39]OJV22582.1 MAG: hypothetical protein BGO21_05350 [Dyadobacter sp. 50-39]